MQTTYVNNNTKAKNKNENNTNNKNNKITTIYTSKYKFKRTNKS